MTEVRASVSAAAVASVIVFVPAVLTAVFIDGSPLLDALLVSAMLPVYSFAFTLILGVPVHLALKWRGMQSRIHYGLSGSLLGAAIGLILFRQAGLPWLVAWIAILTSAGGAAALTFHRFCEPAGA